MFHGVKQIRKKGYIAIWGMIFIMGSNIVYRGVQNFSGESMWSFKEKITKVINAQSLEMFFPAMSYAMESPKSLQQRIGELLQMYGQLQPIVSYIAKESVYETEMESTTTYEEILAMEAADENSVDENGAVVLSEGAVPEAETLIASQVLEQFSEASQNAVQPSEDAVAANTQTAVSGIAKEQPVLGEEYSVDKLDYNFLINHFYTVDNTTSVSASQLDAQQLLNMDMTLKTDNSKPQILIYHTHSQEDFTDSVKGDSSTTIVGVGDYLTQLLQEKYGFNVIHNRETYDLINGKLDRNKAYSLSLAGINKILEENPSIEVVIDMHRDGVEGTRLVSDVNGKPTARFMFFNGLSYTNKNGSIAYLENPYIQDNLAFSLQLQVEAAKYYPGVTRKIYLKGYRYNLHVRPKALLIEVGAQNNTLQEEKNAMEPLADVLARVLTGEK